MVLMNYLKLTIILKLIIKLGRLFLEDYIILVCIRSNFLIILSKENGEILHEIQYIYYESSRSRSGYYYRIDNNNNNEIYLESNYKSSLDIINEQIIIGYIENSEENLIYHIIFLNITKKNNDENDFIIKFEKNLSFSKKYDLSDNNEGNNKIRNLSSRNLFFHCFIIPKNFCIYENNKTLFYYFINDNCEFYNKEKIALTSNSTEFYIVKLKKLIIIYFIVYINQKIIISKLKIKFNNRKVKFIFIQQI